MQFELKGWTAAAALVAFALGCSDTGDDDSSSETDDDDVSCDTDADGDGYLSVDCGGDDCDDLEANVNPGVVELEDWSEELVDPEALAGCESALALDSAGTAHLLYLHSLLDGIDWVGGELRYGTNGVGSWDTTVVEQQQARGHAPSIAVDSTDAVHGVYLDWSDDSLRYLTNADGEWASLTIDSWVQYLNAIALDDGDGVHIAYYWGHPSTGQLSYATNTNGYWDLTTVDEDEGSGSFVDMALDDSGAAHISYYSIAEQSLRYASNASGDWVVTTVDDAGESTGWYTSIALTADGAVHIAYQNGFEHHLTYATNASGSWSTEPVDTGCDGIDEPSLAVDSLGALHIAYTCYFPEWPDSVLRYALNRGGAWTLETAEGIDATLYPSLVLAPDDGVHLACCDGRSDEVWYLTRPAPDGIDNDCDGVIW